MKTFFSTIFMVAFLLCGPVVFAGEHGGIEHGGKEHSGVEHKDVMNNLQPSADVIKNSMKDYVKAQSAKGYFEIFDPVVGKTRRLQLKRIHDRVGKTGDLFYSCADFVDVESGQLLDLDIDVENQNGILKVVDARIHKADGKPRYTYDENDNRILLQVPGR